MRANLFCLEVSHKTAPLAVRERITLDREALPQQLTDLRRICSECVILKTCGRFELYVVSDESCHAWLQHWAELVNAPIECFQPYLREFRGEAAVSHLFQVGAGLESPILGEDHILGQVRNAFIMANEAGSVGPILSCLFRGAIHAGKRIRHETTIGHTARTYAQLAFDQLADIFSRPRDVVVLGSGTLADEVVTKLTKDGRHAVTVVSRHIKRAAALASKTNGQARCIDELTSVLGRTDILIACTSSPRYLVEPSMLRHVHRPLTIIDFGMPRNVDPNTALFPGVQLKSLDQFVGTAHVAENAIEAAQQIIRQEQSRFFQWMKARQAAPLIARLKGLLDGLDPTAAPQIKRAVHDFIRLLREEAAA